ISVLITLLCCGQATVSNKVFVTRQPNWPLIFSGELITLTCEVQGGETTEWTCEWKKSGSIIHRTDSKDWTFIVSESSSGNYMCQNELNVGSALDAVLTFEPNWSTFYSGEFVTFRCDMNEGEDSDWEYKLNINNKSHLSYIPHKSSTLFLHSGEYQCCGRRRSSNQTNCSNTVTVSGKPTATLTAGSTTIPVGGSVTLSCSVEPSAGWKYRWFRRTSDTPEAEITTNKEDNREITVTQGGIYRCDGKRGNPVFTSLLSHDVTIETTSPNKPSLILQPNWSQIYRGEKVTLRCEIQGGTEWTYEWRSTNGNSPSSSEYSIISATHYHSGDYSCRGNRNFELTEWSDAVRLTVIYPRPAASLSVNPDRVQHFRSDSVSLSCEGNSAEWRVMRFTERDGLSDCSYWGTMTGSTCTINPYYYRDGVFWCESKSGEFSNAVNITVHDYNHDVIILVSPVHPVTEGDPVTLSCRYKKQNLLSNVIFYHNNKLINNDNREELNISAVSKSDEGFYKCQHSGKESPRSWMSVRGEED
uniref:Ig-like domain-containing protein n=1 Tax=Xiphophorus maculatus TaxID=8083 RepID=A0A3B5Q4K9_XIPMA